MSKEAILPIWDSIQSRFLKMVGGVQEHELKLQLDSVTIESLMRQISEAGFIYMEWFFNFSIPEHIKQEMNERAATDSNEGTSLEKLTGLLENGSQNVVSAIQALPVEAWTRPVESPMGTLTPLEAIGRLMYHIGMHAGQIVLIQKTHRQMKK